MTLIAEDLLLLLLDDRSGKPATSSLEVALGGALLVELALDERVEVPEKPSVWSSAKVRPVTGGGPLDPILAAALATVT